MKYKNETKEDVMFPVIHDNNLPSDKFIIKSGETKDVPECAVETANSYGLTPVGESPVEAEVSSIGEVKLETKKVKKKTKKSKKVE